jgi:heme iron utilization protein
VPFVGQRRRIIRDEPSRDEPSRDEPSHAERGRTLLASTRTGALSTATPDEGFPFGSLVAYAVDDEGRPVLCLSDLAEHSRNLAADPRASLLAVETRSSGEALSSSRPGPGKSASLATADGDGDPLALARVTVLGTVVELHESERSAALRTYRGVHPDAFYTAFADFRVYRVDVASVRYVGGFARMSWVSAADHAAAEPDPLRPHAAGIVGHMNDDHADALVAYCRAFGNRPATVRAEMLGVDRYGFTVLAADEAADDDTTDRTEVRIPFGRRVDTAGAVRPTMVALLQEARARLA